MVSRIETVDFSGAQPNGSYGGIVLLPPYMD